MRVPSHTQTTKYNKLLPKYMLRGSPRQVWRPFWISLFPKNKAHLLPLHPASTSWLTLGPRTGLGILSSDPLKNWAGRHSGEGGCEDEEIKREVSFRSALELGEPLALDKRVVVSIPSPDSGHYMEEQCLGPLWLPSVFSFYSGKTGCKEVWEEDMTFISVSLS